MTKELYLQTQPARLFFKAAVPGGISMLASSLYFVFDAIFVGKFIGTTAFAALGLALPLVIINFAMAELIGVGSAVPISIFLGKKEDDRANNYFTCAVLLIMLTGLASGLLIYFGAPAFMRFIGATGNLLAAAVEYVRIYAVFSPLTPLIFALDNYLRISGKMRTSMYLNIFMSTLTIALEFVLIVVYSLGIRGAALGSCLAMSACVAIGVAMFVPGKLQLRFVRPCFSKAMLAQIYKNGAAPFLTNISGRIFSIVMNILLLRFGGEAAVAIYGVIMTVAGIIEMLLYGVMDSLQPAIGYNYGAERFDRVKTLEKYVLLAGASISLTGGLALFAFPAAIATPFLEDVSLLELAIVAIRISGFAYLFKWFGTAMQCFFMALAKPLPTLFLSLASALGFPLLLVPLLLPLRLLGLWLNFPLAAFLSAVLAIILIVNLKNTLFIPSPNNGKTLAN